MVMLFVVIGVFVIIGAIFLGVYIKHRNMSFEGEVIDKDIKEVVNQNINNQPSGGISIGGGTDSVTHEYVVKIKTTVGKELHWKVSQGKYEIIKIGDHVSKPSGTTDLTIVSGTTSQQPPVAPPQSPSSTITN